MPDKQADYTHYVTQSWGRRQEEMGMLGIGWVTECHFTSEWTETLDTIDVTPHADVWSLICTEGSICKLDKAQNGLRQWSWDWYCGYVSLSRWGSCFLCWLHWKFPLRKKKNTRLWGPIHYKIHVLNRMQRKQPWRHETKWFGTLYRPLFSDLVLRFGTQESFSSVGPAEKLI